jgi:hypothetical protein
MRVLLLITATVLLGSCDGAEQPVRQLMAVEVEPTANIYWESVQYISNERGVREIVPTTDVEWERTRSAAERLRKFGARLARPAYSEGRGKEWLEFSNALVEVANLAEQAAVEQDVEKVFEVGGTLYYVCESCHQAYPPAEAEPGEADGQA